MRSKAVRRPVRHERNRGRLTSLKRNVFRRQLTPSIIGATQKRRDSVSRDFFCFSATFALLFSDRLFGGAYSKIAPSDNSLLYRS
jgi:hypothetical protein